MNSLEVAVKMKHASKGVALLLAATLVLLARTTLAQESKDFSRIEWLQDVPALLQTRADVSISRDQLFAEYAALFGLGADDAMELTVGPNVQADGTFRTRMRQTRHGVPVLGGEYVLVEGQDGRVRLALGRSIPNLAVDPGRPAFGSDRAVSYALDAIAERTRVSRSDMVFLSRPRAEVVVAPGDRIGSARTYRPAYRCKVLASRPYGAFTVDVNTETGAVLSFSDGRTLAWVDTPATGPSMYDGDVGFLAQQDDVSGEWRLRSALPVSVTTLDAAWGNDKDAAVDYLSPAVPFGPGHSAGVSAHWATQQVLIYYMVEHGRLSYDGLAAPITSYVNWDDPAVYSAAFYPELGHALYAFGPLGTYASLDIVGHEITHGVVKSAAGLASEGEAGALNEALADIFGMLAETFVKGGAPDWVLGDDPGINRILFNPFASQLPKAHGGTFWVDPNSSDDNGGVHTNMGVGNYWFYLLSDGGNGNVNDDPSLAAYSIQGITHHKAGKIAYEMLSYLTSSSTYASARLSALTAASDLYGDFTYPAAVSELAWGAVGVGPVNANVPEMAPNLATDVQPWPAYLEWEAGTFDGDTWDVEVSTASDFSSDVVALTSTSKTVKNGTIYGYVETDLLPAKTYHWRVRSNLTAEKEWRVVTPQFTTAGNVPIPASPIGMNSYHPWKLPFIFTTTAGHYYEVAVYRDDVCKELVFPPKTFEVGLSEPDVTIELTVPKGSMLAWQVRAKLDEQGSVTSDWSTCTYFTTGVPAAALVHPTVGYHYPWPVKFEWGELKGAEFAFVVDALPNQPIGWHWEKKVSETVYPHTMPATSSSSSIGYTWTVHPKGPPFGSEEDPEPDATREEGVAPPTATFFIDGNKTWVPQVGPEWSTSNKWCANVGQALTFEWKPVAGATYYELEVRERSCPLNDPPTPCQPSSVVVHKENYTETSVNLATGNLGSISGPTSHNDHIGYAWNVVAYGAPGLPGVPGAWGEYYLWPLAPTPVAPANGVLLDPADETITFSWESYMAHGGGFVLSIYDDANCNSVDYSTVVNGFSLGTTAVNITSDDWQPGSTQSWRVHPFIYDLCPTNDLHWSSCRTFSFEAPLPPATPSVLDGFWGAVGSLLAVFSKVSNADSYELELSLGTPGNVVETKSWTPQQLYNYVVQLENDLCSVHSICGAGLSVGPSWVVIIDGTQAVNTYFYRVRACNSGGCSGWSSYSQWDEVFAWPWW